METRLASWMQQSPEGATAERILRACVHCGFCLATCPSYQILGDELDSPRGRIYQIKQVLEGTAPTRANQLHLDRCLTCRSCETTCPSGVEYGHLLDIGRAVVAQRVSRPWPERSKRWLLRETLSRRGLFAATLGLARALARALPRSLRAKIGAARPPGTAPVAVHARKVLLLYGCVQPSLQPSIDTATARVLDAIGVQSLVARGSGCCGAIRHHLEDQAGALTEARANINAWWPVIESAQLEAIVINASGCASMVREYGHLLRNDPVYAQKAARVAALTRDPVELLRAATPMLQARLAQQTHSAAAASLHGRSVPDSGRRSLPLRVAFQAPCSQQHGLKLHGEVERLLTALGAQLVPVAEQHLCCGSAGSYSLLQPQISTPLRTRKLHALLREAPQVILSANIGCISHLQAATATPVLHWIEWLDQALSGYSIGAM